MTSTVWLLMERVVICSQVKLGNLEGNDSAYAQTLRNASACSISGTTELHCSGLADARSGSPGVCAESSNADARTTAQARDHCSTHCLLFLLKGTIPPATVIT